MARREPTIHRKEYVVECTGCGSVIGAACYGKGGQRMKGVHKERAELYQEWKADTAKGTA
ncbi:zinc finger domain-containing protein [Streptomyces microflavus]